MNSHRPPLSHAPTDSFFKKRAHRVVDLNDVFGGELSVFKREDPQAVVTKLIRSNVNEFRREFNIFGREDIAAYIVREVTRLLQEFQERPCFARKEKQRFRSQKTLVLVNGAPREEEGEGENGEEFVVARIGNNGLQVVGPTTALRYVKDQIRPEDFFECPNDNGHYYPIGDQYRSSYFELLSCKPKNLLRRNLSTIATPDLRPKLDYADYFGNQTIGTTDDDAFQEALDEESIPVTRGKHRGKGLRKVGLAIDGSRQDFFALGEETLGASVKGELIQYRNHTRGRVHNLAYKWVKGLTAQEKQQRSPHARFGEPPEGSPITIR